ncbi:hypothetical protein AWZ03_011831 [Drosophila navojoa]|uniref:C2 domain-containing protein n=1 Tax=Drosophila navojoa TaxID=7232 RepID=A0A484AZ95_DRONA|nr:hypothetical protein AWZ03_011831 [Drosophila navojoa]
MKTQTTRAYRKSEREVQQLLRQSEKSAAQQTADEDLEARSLQFFHNAEAVDSVDASAGGKELPKDDTPAQCTAASFLQIELAEPPVVSAKLQRQRHHYDSTLFYSPSDRLHLPLQLSECEPQLKPQQIRMLNRFQEEARYSKTSAKLNARFIAQLSDCESGRFTIDTTLYHSNCSRQFKGVFLAPVPLATFHGLPMSRCLKLCLKQLRFSEHPQLLEEHRLAQQLEDLYDLYTYNVNSQICNKLREELQIARNVAARLIDASRQQQQQEQEPSLLAVHVQRQLLLTQQLRKRYYAESRAQRLLLQRLLAEWAKLKELRKRQQFRCTRFSLSLRLVPPADLNLYEKSTITAHSRRLALINAPVQATQRGRSEEKLSFEVTSSKTSSSAMRPKLAGDLYVHIDYYCPDGGSSSNELDDVQPLPPALRQTLLANSLSASAEGGSDAAIRHAPLIFAEQQMLLCSIEELFQNKRFQLLYSRHQQRNFHTKQLSFVPALAHEIVELEEHGPNANVGQLLDPGTIWHPIDLHKHRGRKFLQLLYETIMNQCAQRAKLLQAPLPLLQLWSDGSPTEHSMGWSTIWRALCSIFVRQSGNSPSREPPVWQPQPTCASSQQLQQFIVSLHVVRATGVPVRSRHILNVEQQGRRRNSAGTNSDLSASLFVTQTLMYSNVRPFITLSYGQRLCRSRTAEGSNPTWNEHLQLQLTGQLSDLREDLKISLFDELIEQQYTDEASDLYQRVQCNWLGEYRVPISSLLASRKFEGCIELCMPKVLVGYKRPLIDSVTNISVEQYPEFKESVHLWFYLSVEPANQVKPLQIGGLACAELPQLQQYLRERRLEVQPLLPHPQRYVEPLICTSHGKRVCLTRLLEPVPLPSESQLERVCRFVSLLTPVRSSLDGCQNFEGVWLNNQTLLDSTWCSVKDLGVLLCNYMLALGLECWLLLGLACPYGESTFVIYRQPDSGELVLVAPTTGKRYQLQDVFCPLTRVYSLVTPQNIYINIQAEERVSMTNFDVQNSECWLPVFTKRQEAPRGGIQKRNYAYKRSYHLSQLQKHIERKIMKKISAWRTTRKTLWNRAFQPHLLRILSEMENLSTLSGNRYDEPAFSEELEREFPNYRLYGFTINFAYTNLSAISERIRTSCIHYNNNAAVEFCVAVHINAYANDVLSVWVFLLSIVPLVA